MTPEMFDRPPGGFWVFAYGSLMWHPNFDYADQRPARLHGYHRALCIYSWEYRGTRTRPGLVFGLDRGGSCRGIAFRVTKSNADEVMRYLFEREMITAVYRPRWQTIDLLSDGKQPPTKAKACIFTADPEHEQYTGKLSDAETVRLVDQGCGKAGPCVDYLKNTLDHLNALGIHDQTLSRIVRKCQPNG